MHGEYYRSTAIVHLLIKLKIQIVHLWYLFNETLLVNMTCIIQAGDLPHTEWINSPIFSRSTGIYCEVQNILSAPGLFKHREVTPL